MLNVHLSAAFLLTSCGLTLGAPINAFPAGSGIRVSGSADFSPRFDLGSVLGAGPPILNSIEEQIREKDGP